MKDGAANVGRMSAMAPNEASQHVNVAKDSGRAVRFSVSAPHDYTPTSHRIRRRASSHPDSRPRHSKLRPAGFHEPGMSILEYESTTHGFSS